MKISVAFGTGSCAGGGMGAHILLLEREVVVGSALGILHRGMLSSFPDGDTVVTSVLRCSWLCRAQPVKQWIPADALSYSRD